MKLRPAAVIIAAILCSAINARAQLVTELRYADTYYRFADVSYTTSNGVVLDGFYVGVPGSNELNLGGGYAVKRGALTLTPLVYFVAAKEAGQRGFKPALLMTADSNGWKLAAFLGAFIHTAGSTDNYQVLDTADFTRVFTKRWEIGLQEGFFRAGGSWNNQLGPLIKFNDSHGAWAVSYRFGNQDEFRVGRVWVF